ncbi:NACHT domain-containing protein [Streptomyces puniciscabiei]|uniref:NACHT domain-containing protein n=1 Tax=Streptomyces puniciscabiei TaxID=164348 RepID=A0A542UE30_9ACTN|nr:NACHT domain-containing protein [Streptomyces puniciscabiei]TQK97333.1 NACHT domain-containing protein [Streptomyces puniciscabiei]
MTGLKWSRPAAGREPAAAALLSWLADPDAPRLCVVTGSAGCGKSTLLAWLIGHGTRQGTRPDRRVHGFVPLSGLTALTAAWTLAEQLHMAARTPGELVEALAADERRTVLVLPELHEAEDAGAVAELVLALVELPHVRLLVEVRSGSVEAGVLTAAPSAVMDLDQAQWADPERYAAWAATQPADRRTPVENPPGTVDLNDPVAVCAADPWQVSVGYERSADAHGGLRAAWLRAGASLTREQTPADRAVVLLSALGDDADPRLPQALAGQAEGAAWRVVWRRVRGDVRPPWPGPARALSSGRGHLAGKLVVADHQGTVRLVDEAQAAPVGRLPEPVAGVRAVAAVPEGDVLVLDAEGRLHTRRSPAAPRATGLAALLEDRPTPLERLVEAARSQVGGPPVALAYVEGLLAVGDTAGLAHVFSETDGEPRPLTARLHEGEVAAVAALRLEVSDDAPGIPLIYSGGYDGTVRAWSPGAEPLASPVRSRPCPVTALAAASTDTGPVLAVAWADGLVEHEALDEGGQVRPFWSGAPVHSLALSKAGHLLIGTDETLACLRPA